MHYFKLRAKSADDAVQQATEMLRQSGATGAEATVALENLNAHLRVFGTLAAEDRLDVHMNGSAVTEQETAVLVSCGSGCTVLRVRELPPDEQVEQPPAPT